VFHDPEMRRRRAGLMALPYEHPEQVQRLLAEVVERVKEKKLNPRTGNTLGYLATLLMQNQPRIEKEQERVKDAQYGAELQAAVDEWMEERAKRLEAKEGTEGRD
jgi:predicted NodU family carbamoyl transferase